MRRDLPSSTGPSPATGSRPATPPRPALRVVAATTPALRQLAGLDAERARLDIRTMVLEAKEPLWSMGDDTPTPARARIDRPVVDHLRQAFAQVTNPPIDPERERAVMDLRVELGRRPALLGGIPAAPRTIRLDRPVVADLDGIIERIGRRRVRRLDATWRAADGPAGLAHALDALATDALLAVETGSVELLVISDRTMSLDRPPLPSVLAVGAVHTALGAAGLRGRADLVVDAADILDVHGLAMAVAAGATAVRPRLAIELAAELAGSRGAETLTAAEAVRHLLEAFEAGLRKTLARMGISAVASYVGGALFETLELAPEVVERCFPSAAAWPGRIGFEALAERGLRRLDAARALAAGGDGVRLADPGLARFRADGELHLYAPVVVKALQAVADGSSDLRTVPGRDAAVVRDGLRIRRPRGTKPVPLDEVEPARSIARRFVASAMSVGALSPEAHQAVTIGMQRAGGAANTGEGGEDPAWYRPTPSGERHDARIKQVASARFGVTATYLARADQLEIKIAQGSKPGEGGQLPAKKATAEIAALRRAQPGQSLISPPPHHDIYSIEDLAQLIADLRAINPRARIGVKLVASRGVGTIAAGVVKAGADYVHLSGHAGGTGASPLSSIKHAGAPWELGLAEVHQTLLRNGLRDRVVLRTDGGLQVGRDVLVAALLGAEEFGFGTATLVALGCDMARQCHLDTCPTGIATQRADLRAKFTGTPEQVERFALAVAEDLRRELAAIGARSVGEIVGESRRYLSAAGPEGPTDVGALVGAAGWAADDRRRASGELSIEGLARAPASPVEHGLVTSWVETGVVPTGRLADRHGGSVVRRRAVRGDRARRHPPAERRRDPARAQRRGRAELRRVPDRRRRAEPRRPGQRLRRQGSVRRGRGGPPGAGGRGRSGRVDARRERLPVRGDGRPAPRRRPGGDAVRRPEQRRRGGRRGARRPWLRVHDRRRRGRPRTGRSELRRRDDRRPGLPPRPDRSLRSGAGRDERGRDSPVGGRPRPGRRSRAGLRARPPDRGARRRGVRAGRAPRAVGRPASRGCLARRAGRCPVRGRGRVDGRATGHRGPDRTIRRHPGCGPLGRGRRDPYTLLRSAVGAADRTLRRKRR